jgi:membrane protein DedA with SNARE-associated domain
MFQNLESVLLSFIHTLPLELFVFVASFIEEVIAPVPSAAVLLVTGSFAAIQDKTLLDLIPLAVIAALGKTIGAIIVYYFSDKIGGMVITKFGNFFDVSHASIKEFGSKITGGPRDYLFLTVFRALPILPSSVVSIGCGLMKIPIRLFIITTFIGTIVRDSIFLYIGYKGTEILNTFATKSANMESAIQISLLVAIILVLTYFYFKRRK